MRRIFAEEEKATPRQLPLVEPEQEKQQVEQAVPKVSAQPRKKAGRSNGALRWAILIFGSIGIFAMLTPAITGVPLAEYLQNADFKKAYSSNNLKYMRGMAAVKAGNLAAATDTLMALQPKSTEADELSSALFPLLMEAKDYERVAKIIEYLNSRKEQAENGPVALGVALGNERGLKGALDFLTQNADAARYRTLIVPGIFGAVATKEMPALEALTATLSGEEKVSALQTIVRTYTEAQYFKEAWQWSEQLPEAMREQLRIDLVNREARVSPKTAVQHLSAMKTGSITPGMQNILVMQMMSSDLQAAAQVAATIPDEKLKKSALEMIKSQTEQQKRWTEQLAEVDAKEPYLRVDPLLSLLMQNSQSLRVKDEILPRLLALTKNDPQVTKLYDDVLRYVIVQTTEVGLRKKYLSMMLNPEVRAALAKELETETTIKAEIQWGNTRAMTSGTGKITQFIPGTLSVH
ncbi:MAG: hypothetical protein QM758_27320 [Armatimonas sp.]